MPVTYEKVLCAVNLTESAEEMIKHAASICKRYNAQLYLLYSMEEKTAESLATRIGRTLPGETLREYQQLLATLEERDSFILKDMAMKAENLYGCQVETIITRGKPHEEILKTAQEKDVDLIVIGSHSFPPLGKVLLGSTAEKVLHRARRPVLLIPVENR